MAEPGAGARPGTILQRGRAKAYRPLPPERRRDILREGLAAYDRGDYFLAHEVLEPAWMGASDPAERDLYQGLIKLAAAFVHQARGNPAGVAKNLRGAVERLIDAGSVGVGVGIDLGVDMGALMEAVAARLAVLDARSADDPLPEPLPIPRTHRPG